MSLAYLLDTDTCVHWLRGRETVRQQLAAAGPSGVGLSVVTLAELRYGADCSARPEANHVAIDDFVSGLTVVGLDDDAARTFGSVKAELRRQGMLIEDSDLFIAATARARGLTLVTNNTEHFRRVPGLTLENWL
jgi:tRNA(fMet)-specific endonuclease VapC